MLMSFPENRFSAHWISMIQEPDGPVLQNLSSLEMLWKKRTGACRPPEQKCAVNMPILIWGMYSRMARGRRERYSHEFRFNAFHSERKSGAGRIRKVSETVSIGKIESGVRWKY